MTKPVSEYLNDLALGHLANLSMAENGYIRVSDEGRIITAMNNALSRMFTRLPLSEKEVTIIMKPHITTYLLNSRYSIPHGDPSIEDKYIFDPVEKFGDDVIQVISAWDEFSGFRPLNIPASPYSIYTPNQTTLDVPVVLDGIYLHVAYQASHPKLRTKEDTVDIGSPALDTPFLHLVSSLVYGSIGSAEATQQSGRHYSIYDASIKEMEEKGYFTQANYLGGRQFRLKGWV